MSSASGAGECCYPYGKWNAKVSKEDTSGKMEFITSVVAQMQKMQEDNYCPCLLGILATVFSSSMLSHLNNLYGDWRVQLRICGERVESRITYKDGLGLLAALSKMEEILRKQ